MKRKKVIIIATLVSHLLDPAVALLLITVLVLYRSHISESGLLQFILFVPLSFGIPLGYMLWKLKTGEIRNWEITSRKERIKPFLIFLGSLLLDIFIVSTFGNPILLRFIILLFLWLLGFFCITLFWKISGHSGINTFAALLFLSWYGLSYWPVLLIIPIVSWARIVRGVHTPMQVLGGIAYSTFIVYVGVRLLGV